MSDDKVSTGSTTGGVEQPAAEQSPANVPAPAGEVHPVGRRQGMFGVHGSGDTSGYGGLVAPIVYPGAAQRPYGGWYDEVADALEERLRADGLERPSSRWSSTAARSPSTCAARTSWRWPRCCATSPGCASSSARA